MILALQIYNIAAIANRPSIINSNNFHTAVKVFYEFRDSMMLIPGSCIEFTNLKVCYLYHTNEILKFLIEKYQLKRTMRGATLFFYLHAVNIELYAKVPQINWDNFTLMKNYFYQNLFSVLTNYKNYFLIKTESTLDDLDNLIGIDIQYFRNLTSHGGRD